MNKIKIALFFLLIPLLISSQENKLQGFDHLVNKTWLADGKWSNGGKFKQEVSFNYDLNNTIVITNSKGFIDQNQSEYGNRNHGVRQYNAKKDKIEFWEFDVFGGVTHGEVEIEGKDIYYHYNYGGSLVTDCWKYVDDKTYRFTVGSYEDGKWKAIYIQTDFKLKNKG